jgi:NAD(P)-dependent dehydrogenase (short-subunit alcohol dehydrogenase family)
MSGLSGKTTIVVGASRGLGRGIATALAAAGTRVVAVSRTTLAFPEPIRLEVAECRGGHSRGQAPRPL